jgi:uncharacterized membrane protein
MAGASNRFPPLYIAACIIFAIGIAGLCSLFFLQLPTNVFKGLLSIFFGLTAFGIGETLNHPRISQPTLSWNNNISKVPRIQRKRNVCSLGNLCDIGALLLFFIGLSTLFFPR